MILNTTPTLDQIQIKQKLLQKDKMFNYILDIIYIIILLQFKLIS